MPSNTAAGNPMNVQNAQRTTPESPVDNHQPMPMPNAASTPSQNRI